MKNMIGMTRYIDNEIVFPEESDKEIAAIDALREDFDEDLDFRTLFDELLGKVDEWKNTNKKYNTRVYEKLGNVYRLYIFTYRNPKRERLVERKCDEHEIPKTKASHLSIRVVRLMMRPPIKTAYQYAAVLRYASMNQIAPSALAAELAKKGSGIAEMADRFSGSTPRSGVRLNRPVPENSRGNRDTMTSVRTSTTSTTMRATTPAPLPTKRVRKIPIPKSIGGQTR
jgi:hypothetical protein